MIDAGKNVLCEKPLTMNEKQTESLMKHAHEKGVFFMEAIWSRSFPVYKKLAELIQSGVIGDVQVVNVNFGFPLEHVSRVRYTLTKLTREINLNLLNLVEQRKGPGRQWNPRHRRLRPPIRTVRLQGCESDKFHFHRFPQCTGC